MVSGLSHVQTLIACALVALLVWAVQQVRVLDARMEAVQAQEKLATAQTAAVAQARKKEREWQAQADAIAARYEQEKRDAEKTHARVVADLRSGNTRLRAHWQGCVATGELSRAALDSARDAEAAELRRKGAADLVRLSDQCDADIRFWQRAYGAIEGAQL